MTLSSSEACHILVSGWGHEVLAWPRGQSGGGRIAYIRVIT